MDIGKIFSLVNIIKNGVFAVILIIAGIFLAFDAKSDNEHSNVLVMMSISFFLAAGFLVYKLLPKTNVTNIIDQSANKMHLGSLIVTGIFFIASIFIFNKIVHSDSVNWIAILIFIAFIFAIGQTVYQKFFKR